MLEKFNNIWIILLSIIIIIIIIRKIYNLIKPNNKNQTEKFSFNIIKQNLPLITSYYVGLHK